MSFCGSRQGSLSVREGVLKNKCFVDVLRIFPHGIFIILSLIILIAWRQSAIGKLKAKTWVHFHCHNIRWILTLILILVNGLDIVEGLVSDNIDPDTPNYHVIVPPCVALVSSVLSIILYHNIEMWNSPRFLLIFIPYWACSFGLKLLKAFSLYANEIRTEHLRLWITWIAVALYCLLLLVEFTELLKMRYAFFKTHRRIHPPPELENTRYYATFCNFLSRVTFWWMNSMLIEGYRHPLASEHLGALPKTERALGNYRSLLESFELEKTKAAARNTKPSFHRTYIRSFWPPLLLAALFRFLGDMLAFVGPWSIEKIINFAYSEIATAGNVSTRGQATGSPVVYIPTADANVTLNSTEDVSAVYYVTVNDFFNNGYSLCALLFVTTLLQHTFLHYHHYLVILQGVRLRAAVQTMVYTKALRLSSLNITNGKTTLGQIMNHMTMDSNFLMRLFFFIHYLWATPLQIVVALTLMYLKLGISAVAGGLLIVISAPIQVFVGRGMSNMQKKVMHEADKRVKRCNEVIHGIKVVKLLGWEAYMTKNINEARTKELKCLFINAIYRTLFTFISTAVPALATLVTFILYPYIEKEPLTAGKTLSTLALFNILAIPMVLFTLFTSSLILANVSAKRLVPYFLAPEVEGQHGVTDTLQTATESLSHDADGEHIQLNLLSARDKHDHISASICSLASHHSHSPVHHARHSSSASLLDFGTEHHSNLAAALSVNNDHHNFRRHHYNGVSIEEEEEQYVVEVQDGSFSWDLDTRELSLRNINLHVPAGRLVIVVGQVGSGKSSLLLALLGEMLTVSGHVSWTKSSSTAYVSQKPWLMNKTLKDNILFGNQFKWKRYQKVIEACALQPDIDMLPAGDQTEIGEKGVNLSGGQKQRVSIARALYSSADTYIMDDPLSALDAHVGKHVFDEVIMKKLLCRKKTVILVTHQLQYLNSAHLIVVMKEGAVEYQGKLSEVKKTHPELYESWRKALKEAKSAESSRRDSDSHSVEGILGYTRQTSIQSQVSVDESRTRDIQPRISTVSAPGTVETSQHPISNGGVEEEEEEEEVQIKGKDKKRSSAAGSLIKKEHRETGTISYRVYMMHLSACGWPLVTLVFLLLLVNQSLLVSTNCWIAIWTSASTKFVNNQPQMNTKTTNITAPVVETFDDWQYIHVYLALSLTAVIITLCSGFALQFTGVRGSKNLHSNMLSTVLQAPLRFFDTNPTGRIINRFSSDIGQIDQKIPGTWDGFLRCALATLAAVIVNCIGTPFFLLAVVPLCVLYFCMQRFYTATARELQRLDSVTTSPIFSHFSETLNGLQVIRAYKAQGRFRHKAMATIDTNIAPMLFSQAANRWLGIRLDYMGAILVFTSGVASLSAGLSGSTDPAFIGLCIAYALMVSNYLNWIVRNSSDLEMMMNAVERVEEYTKLETESTTSVDSSRQADWPSQGQIEFRKVSLRYDESLDAVINNISFTISPGELIGVCGRTGSGKSSLMLSLFRMIDLAEGEILIDGVNIANVTLHELRSKLAIIPQDPILFTGTVRYNLDPTGQLEENKLWLALESVQLKETIEALPDKLDASISEGGENFSVGQKQLFCLARAFLRENLILVLDEATASIDLETDNKLQHVITTVFKGRTVITIAHRVSTIMRYHRVMTLREGHLVEFGPPQDLIQQEDSLFAQLVKQSQHK